MNHLYCFTDEELFFTGEDGKLSSGTERYKEQKGGVDEPLSSTSLQVTPSLGTYWLWISELGIRAKHFIYVEKLTG